MKTYQLEEITQHYDALILDIWGVVYEGNDPYKNTVAFLNNMTNSGKQIVFLSNSPRPSSVARQRFFNWGIDMSDINIYTSGDEVREKLTTWDDEVFRQLWKSLDSIVYRPWLFIKIV